MDGEVISISSSSNSSSGCSSADLIDTDDHTSKDEQGQLKNATSEQNNSGSITTEPVRDSDAACNDWEIYETWTILGEPVIKPIITEPLKQQQHQKLEQTNNSSVQKLSDISITATFADVIEDEPVVLSEPTTVQNSTNNSLTIPTDVGCRNDCDTPSDGISVISDCSDCALHRDSPVPPNETQPQTGHKNSGSIPFDTPPTTPRSESPIQTFKTLPPDLLTRESSDKFSLESKPSRPFEVVSPANIILFSLLAGITGIVLGNAFRVRPEEDSSILNHISPLVLRIQDLERENSNLKTQLKKFKPVDAGASSGPAGGPEVVFPQPLDFYLEQDINENGKRVWTGDPNNEGPITLENPKLKMPDFCGEDTADDLFSERYQQICDGKVKKSSQTVQDSSQMQSDTASSICSGCQSCCASSGTKQSDVEANFADDDESSVDRIKLERDKSPQIKRKLKRKPIKDDSSDSSDTVINDHDKPVGGARKGCAGIFEKRKKDKTNSKEDKENKKTKKASDDWYEKRKSGRDEMRRSNGAASSGTDDWFSKRASNREKQRGNGFDKKK